MKGLNQFVNNVLYNWGNGGAYIMGDTEQKSNADIRNCFIVGTTDNYDGKGAKRMTISARDNKDGVLNGRELERADCMKKSSRRGDYNFSYVHERPYTSNKRTDDCSGSL